MKRSRSLILSMWTAFAGAVLLHAAPWGDPTLATITLCWGVAYGIASQIVGAIEDQGSRGDA